VAVNPQDTNLETPLHLASRFLSLEVVWVLLKHVAEINVENNAGKVPLRPVQESREHKITTISTLTTTENRSRSIDGSALRLPVSGQSRYKRAARELS
jgi:ankyrin repeat protein